MNGRSLWRKIWFESPVIFPTAALFHIFLFLRSVFDFHDSLAENWPTVLWYGVACALSVACVFLKRAAALGYIIFAIVGLLIQFVIPLDFFWKNVGSTLFPFDLLMCFFLLFYYKRFR